MAYAPTTWVDGVTPVNAANLNKLEIGLQNAVGIPADVAVPAASFLIRNKLLVADAQPAFRINGDGKMEWGVGGATAPAVNLYMQNGTLVTDDALWARGFLGSESAIYREAGVATEIALEFYLRVWPGADHFKMLVNGQMQWGPGTSPLDVTLRRYGVTTLGLDGSLVVLPPPTDSLPGVGRILLDVSGGWAYPVLDGEGTGIAFQSGGTDNMASWEIYTQNAVEGITIFRKPGGAGPTHDLFRFTQGGLRFGPGGATGNLAVFDTRLYRSGAATLRTDGTFQVGASLQLVSDSGTLYFGAANDTYVIRTGAADLTTNAKFNAASLASRPTGGQVGWHSNPASGANYLLYHQVQGEAYPRFTMDGGGSISWGGGAATTDITLQRTSPGGLFTQANLTVNTIIPAAMYLGSGTFFINGAGLHEWGPGDWSRDTNLYRVQPGILGTDGQIYLRGAASYLAFNVPGDAAAKFYISANGYHAWGSGAAAPDTNLYRSMADQLMTDDTLVIGGYLDIRTFGGGSAGAVGIYMTGLSNDGSGFIMAARRGSDPDWRFQIVADGKINWGNGTTTDTALYRASAGTLRTDTSLIVGSNLVVLGELTGTGRLDTVAKTIADWNLAVTNGWYMGASLPSAPTADVWYIGEVTVHNASWITQRVWNFTLPAGSPVWERRCLNGVWGSWVQAAAGVDLVYEGAHVPATAYTDGDIVVYNGQAYICVRPTSTAPTWTTSQGSAIGTALPASPVDGQEFTLVDSLTAPTYQWRFRWMPSITLDSYEWVFIGGSPKYISNATVDTHTGDSVWTDASGMSYTVPRAGLWNVEWGARILDTINGQQQLALGLYIGTAPVFNDSALGHGDMSVSRRIITAAIAASTLLKLQYQGTGDTKQCRDKWMAIQPVRCS